MNPISKISPRPTTITGFLSATQAQARFREGLALHNKGQLAQAHAIYHEVLELQPGYFDALHMLGVLAGQTNNPTQAVEWIGKAIEVNPNSASAYSNLGNALRDLKRHQEAIASYDKAIAMNPNHANAHANRGKALYELQQYQAAIASYDKAIVAKPDHADAYCDRGLALSELKQHEAAIASYDKAVAIKPGHALAHCNRGVALYELGQHQAAVESYDKAIAIQPDYADACSNRGNALHALKRHQAAIASYDKAISIKPDHAEAYYNRGVVLSELQQHRAAIASYDKAIAIKPDHAGAYSNRGNALLDLMQHQAAIDSYGQALAIRPDSEFLYGIRLHTKMQISDWSDAGSQVAELVQKIARNEKATTPFSFLALIDSLPLQRKAAEIWVQERYPASFEIGTIPRRTRSEKIRIGYFSMDFKNHPVSFLTAELFESHDRDKFEIYAFSFGPDTRDEMRARLERAFDKFIDVEKKSDKEIAEMARLMGIDIAVDLAGLTADSRTGIFALRAAPLQVNYIGYPGTMGADYMDYLIADKQLIPQEAKVHYAERIVYLPSFQVNDGRREISDKVFTREELGLPQSGFVFCCFNNNYKITPSTFDGWMRILKKVEGSVLFLYSDTEQAVINLRNEATQRGVDADRLVFGRKLPAPEYLARYRAADLFLDTLPFNAGTTASDALWAGLPVLTRPGEVFASRMAASLLNAINLPELIASTQEEYEALAVAVATKPERLKSINEKLGRNRLVTPLFNTKLFTQHIEDAYLQMYERYHAGLAPDHIYVGTMENVSLVDS